MDRNNIIKLSVAVYNVTNLFPSGEPLKNFLRKKANDILGDLIVFLDNSGAIIIKKEEKENFYYAVLKNINIIYGYLEVAGSQKWVNPVNLAILKNEYDKIKHFLIESEKKEKDKRPERAVKEDREEGEEADSRGDIDVSKDRCKRIIQFLSEKDKVQIQELKDIFPDVSKRTLRRDFDYLMDRNLVERVGEGRETYYRMKPFKAILA